MKVTYTDPQGVTFTLLEPTAADIPRFIKAVRAEDGKVVIVHDSDVRVEQERKD
jgi:hypothetical protein